MYDVHCTFARVWRMYCIIYTVYIIKVIAYDCILYYTALYIVHCTSYGVYTIIKPTGYCTPYIVQCALYTVQCTPYSVHRIVYTAQCTPYNVHRTLYTVHCTTWILHRTLYTVHYTTCIVHRKLYTIRCTHNIKL